MQKALCQAYIDLLRESLRKQRYPRHSSDPPVALLYPDKTILAIGRTCDRLDPIFPMKLQNACELPDIVRKET